MSDNRGLFITFILLLLASKEIISPKYSLPITTQIGEKGGGGDDVSSDEDDEQQNEDDDDDDDGPGKPQSSPIFRCNIGHLFSSVANETSLSLSFHS